MLSFHVPPEGKTGFREDSHATIQRSQKITFEYLKWSILTVQKSSLLGLTSHHLKPETTRARQAYPSPSAVSEREIFTDNLLVRVHLTIEMSRPALRHGSLNSLFQVALSRSIWAHQICALSVDLVSPGAFPLQHWADSAQRWITVRP